jgi:hypothetical protein
VPGNNINLAVGASVVGLQDVVVTPSKEITGYFPPAGRYLGASSETYFLNWHKRAAVNGARSPLTQVKEVFFRAVAFVFG